MNDTNTNTTSNNETNETNETLGNNNKQSYRFSRTMVARCKSVSFNRFLFVLMGMGALFPYNALISCVDYFSDIHPDVEEDDLSAQIAASCITALLITTLLLLPFSSPKDKRKENFKKMKNVNIEKNNHNHTGNTNINDVNTVNTSKISLPLEGNSNLKINFNSTRNHQQTFCTPSIASPHTRIILGYILTCLFLILMPLLPQSSLSISTLNVFSFLMGIGDALSQSGLYVYAARYQQPSYSAALTLGSAISGLAVSLLRLSTRHIQQTQQNQKNQQPQDLRPGFSILFYLCGIFVLVCILSFFILQSCHPHHNEPTSSHDDNTTSTTITPHNNHDFCNGHEREEETDNLDQHDLPTEAQSILSTNHQHNRTYPNFTTRTNQSFHRRYFQIYIETLRITWKPTLSAFLNFFITLSLFPGTIVSFPASNDGILSFGEWLPVVLITVFNAADVVGRAILSVETWRIPQALLQSQTVTTGGQHEEITGEVEAETTTTTTTTINQNIPGHILLPNYNSMVWYPTLARVLFYPLIALCKVPSSPRPIISSDLLRCILVFLFGVTNGYIQSANFMMTPTMILDHEDKKDASSMLLLLSIYFGLTAGAFSGLLVNHILRAFS